MRPASHLVLDHWIENRWDPQRRRALVRQGLVFSSVWIVLCLAVIWLTGSQVDTCQHLAGSGLTASRNIESSLAFGGSHKDLLESRLAEHLTEIRRSSEALQRRLGFAAWLLPRRASDAIAELIRVHMDLESALRPGSHEPLRSRLQPPEIQNKVHDLAGAWLRVSTTLTGGDSAIQRLVIFATAAACLLLLVLAFVVPLHSDSPLKDATHLLEGMAAKISNGEIFRSEPLAGKEELRELPESLAGFSESFELLARLLQGHCQIAVRVLDFLTPGVAILSGKLSILAANHPFGHLAGGTPDSIQGKPLCDVFPSAMPLLQAMDSASGAQGGRDVMRVIKGEGERIYRARLTEILPGEGDAGIFVLMLADAADATQRGPDPSEFKKLYEKILESVSEAILLVERDGSVIDVSPPAAKLVGRSRKELAGARLQSLQKMPLAGAEEALDAYVSSPNWQMDGRVLKTHAVRKDGTTFAAEFRFSEFRAGGRAGYLVNLRDVTDQEAADSLARERLRVIEMIARNQPLETVLSGVTELVEHQMPGSYCVVLLKQGDRLVPAIPPRLPQALVESFCDLPLDSVVSACTRAHEEGRTTLFNDIVSQRVWEPFRYEASERGVRSFLSVPVFSSEGRVVGLIAAYRPETDEPRREQAEALQLASQLASVCVEQRELNGQLAYKAQHDALTGLLNRLSFEEELRHAIARAARAQRLLAILSVDLDRFKLVNDTLGHAAGDELIKQVATRLTGCLRETDVVARWGGDEFVIGLVEIADPEDAQLVADKLVNALSTPFDIAGHLSVISASVGVSVFPHHGSDLDTLIRHADSAMYQAKKGGRNAFHCYDAALGETDRQRLELETQLGRALDRGELALHYQPQIDLRTRSLAGMEALLRWQSRQSGLIMPATFIPIAEESGAIVPIGEWVIREACKQVKEFRLAGLGHVRIAVNVSRIQFARPDFVKMVTEAVTEAGIEPHLLELELTESLLMEPGDESAPRMAELRALGIKMSIDDFGTGYSSLSYLQRLPIDHLKIDRTFVQELDASSRTPLLVESIVALSASLGMLSIAEGVESPSELDVLSATGCDLVQGDLFCKPLPVEQLIPQLQKHRASGGWHPRLSRRRRRGPVPVNVPALAKRAAAG